MIALDLFCGGGGASMGINRAGFEVVGIDREPQPEYPFRFVRGDALRPPVDLSAFDFIWASPPCQRYTTASNRYPETQSEHPDLIAEVRRILRGAGVPYVIENVLGARDELEFPILLSGGMFGLRVYRPRLFECNFIALAPSKTPTPANHVPVYGKLDGRRVWTRVDGSELRAPSSIDDARDAMGIDWLSWDALRESIPPDYAEYLARFVPREVGPWERRGQ